MGLAKIGLAMMGWATIGWATMGLGAMMGSIDLDGWCWHVFGRLGPNRLGHDGFGQDCGCWPRGSELAGGVGDGRWDRRWPVRSATADGPMGSAMADGSEALTPRRATDGRTLAGLCFFFCCYVFRLVISWLWIMGGSALVLACGGDGEAGRGGVGDGRKGCGMFVMRGAGVVGPEPHRVV